MLHRNHLCSVTGESEQPVAQVRVSYSAGLLVFCLGHIDMKSSDEADRDGVSSLLSGRPQRSVKSRSQQLHHCAAGTLERRFPVSEADRTFTVRLTGPDLHLLLVEPTHTRAETSKALKHSDANLDFLMSNP